MSPHRQLEGFAGGLARRARRRHADVAHYPSRIEALHDGRPMGDAWRRPSFGADDGATGSESNLQTGSRAIRGTVESRTRCGLKSLAVINASLQPGASEACTYVPSPERAHTHEVR